MSQNSHPTVPAGRAPQPDTGAVRGALQRLAVAHDAGAAMSPLVAAAADALGVSPRHGVAVAGSGPAVGRGLGLAAGRRRCRRLCPLERQRIGGVATSARRGGRHAQSANLSSRPEQTFRARRPGRAARGLRGPPPPPGVPALGTGGPNELWGADHKQLDVAVLFPRARKPRKPWVTTFVDGYCRAVMGWAIAEYPSAATVLPALAEAIRLDEHPRALLWHSGCGASRPGPGVRCRIVHQRVWVSRRPSGADSAVHPLPQGEGGTLPPHDRDRLPGGAAAVPGRPAGRRREASRRCRRAVLVGSGGPFQRLGRRLQPPTPPRRPGGSDPEERWRLETRPARGLSPRAELRWLLLEEQTRKVAKSGIRFHCLDFVAPELNGLVGETVDVRYRPHDDTSIEVFRNGAQLCSRLPQGALGQAERAAVLERRRADAARQARVAGAPPVAPGNASPL